MRFSSAFDSALLRLRAPPTTSGSDRAYFAYILCLPVLRRRRSDSYPESIPSRATAVRVHMHMLFTGSSAGLRDS